MNKLVKVLASCVVLAALYQGGRAFNEWRSLNATLVELKQRISDISDKDQKLASYRHTTPLKLDTTYNSFLDDMHSIACVYGLGISVEGGSPVFGVSPLDGLDQAKVKVVFSHIASRGALISLLATLDVQSRSGPILVEKMTQEKDRLVMETIVYGA